MVFRSLVLRICLILYVSQLFPGHSSLVFVRMRFLFSRILLIIRCCCRTVVSFPKVPDKSDIYQSASTHLVNDPHKSLLGRATEGPATTAGRRCTSVSTDDNGTEKIARVMSHPPLSPAVTNKSALWAFSLDSSAPLETSITGSYHRRELNATSSVATFVRDPDTTVAESVCLSALP